MLNITESLGLVVLMGVASPTRLDGIASDRGARGSGFKAQCQRFFHDRVEIFQLHKWKYA